MSTKQILITLVGIIIIGGALYLSMSKKNTENVATTAPVTIDKNEITTSKDLTMEPSKNASNDEIIDYIVDGQSSDETTAAEASLKTSSTATVEEPTISTNF